MKRLLFLLCMVVAGSAWSADCAEGQLPFLMTTYHGFSLEGATAEAACHSVLAHEHQGGYWTQAVYEGISCVALGHPNGANDGEVGQVSQQCGPVDEEPEEPVAIDWTNSAHVMQAIYWSFMFFLFAHGFRTGDRLV